METNPVGIARNVLDPDVEIIVRKWKAENSAMSWWKKSKVGYTQITAFILNSLDKLIIKIEEYQEINGPDKKATVLEAIKSIWAEVVKEAVPIWLKPFIPIMRFVIIEIIVPYMIDWIVEKYNKGWWKREINKEVKND